ncbi:DNA-binding protein [Actinocorallia longicatena]|uniref:DNA-binding protein n=1 Tax=Actinocorallia longicatena TaxID=111803 RepID=A0ABP6QFN9_9ACTN
MSEPIVNTEAADLLAAGAVLLPGTEGAGERAVPLTARAYRHPGLDDRTVVRLVAAELGAAEDLAAGFLGLELAGDPEVVGLGLRASLGFPEWVLVHHPEDGHHALAVVPELERTAKRTESKPKAALDAYLELAAQLAAAVPHFLPTFFEQAGRDFLAADNTTYAAQMFTRARNAEAEHGLAIDEMRLDAVFLEFALAGALPVKVLSGYARELAARVPAGEALRRFTRLCVRRTSGGLPPSAQMTNDLRRLARGAGQDAAAVELDYIAEVLSLPATPRAAMGWWKAHQGAIMTLARQRPETRGTLLNLTPAADDGELPSLWLGILEESGATVALCDPSAVPEESRPQDGTVGWFERFTAFWCSGWRRRERPPGLNALVERMADRLRAEIADRGTPLAVPEDVDLLDLLLALGVPVTEPGRHDALALARWAEGENRRDLTAIEADPRFRPAFLRGIGQFSNGRDGLAGLRLLAASTGGCPMLAEWMREVARRSTAVGLPDLPEALERLGWLPGEVLALAEDAVREAATSDLAGILARTLQAGIFDELAWPAWEEAAAGLVGAADVDDLLIADAWPHLIVAGAGQARVIGAEGTVLTHDLRIPAADDSGSRGFHYVDGSLLVYWGSRQSGGLRGYWHTSADRQETMDAPGSRTGRMYWYQGHDQATLPVPGGGRTTGAGVLHRGDTVVPGERAVVTDGTSYWVWAQDETDPNTVGWHEHDPVSGRQGRRGMPAFFADATRDAPEGSTFLSGRLLPASGAEATPAGTPVNGLLGWRLVQLPDGSVRGEDLAGHTVTLRELQPSSLLFVPGDDRPRSVVHGGYRVRLVDPDGVVTSVVKSDMAPGRFAAGTPILPPVSFWHCLRPRDPQGSAALRRIDPATAEALLKAAAHPDDDLPATVGTLLPEVGHQALLAGIAEIVRYAAEQQKLLDSVAERLERELAGGVPQSKPAGPSDDLLQKALNGLGITGSWYGNDDGTSVFEGLRALDQAVAAGPRAEEGGPGVHLDGLPFPAVRLDLVAMLDGCAAVSVRAASPFTGPEQRAALGELLRSFDALGPVTAEDRPSRWRRVGLHLDETVLTDAAGKRRDGHWHGLLPLDGGAFLAVLDVRGSSPGFEFTALHHDPEGRFEVPAPYTERSSRPVGERRNTGWLAAFLAGWEASGPVSWRPEAAEEFARLTGVTETMAKLIVAGLPCVDSGERNFLTPEIRAVLGIKAADAAVARDELRRVDGRVRRSVVGALLPADPARWWTEGPDVAAAAEAWNREVGRRTAVPEALLAETVRAVRTDGDAATSLRALLDPAGEPGLSRDLVWVVRGDRVVPEDQNAVGFTAGTLIGTVALTAWLAHRLPAGDPIRAALPAALAAVRERLAAPGLVLDLDRFVGLTAFRKVAGAPTEIGEGFERYGAVIMATADDQPSPGIRTALLDAAGADPYLPALRGDSAQPFPAEMALRIALDQRFAALLADPGDPVAGDRAADGTWWPQDPSRSVPELVAETAARYGIGADAATVYLILLAMPDPTDRTTSRWTGWKPARLKAARTELAATDLVVEAKRSRAGRTLFLPCGWTDSRSPRLPMEAWKLPMYDLLVGEGTGAPLSVAVPAEPVADLYRRACLRIADGDVPRFAELKVRRGRRR